MSEGVGLDQAYLADQFTVVVAYIPPHLLLPHSAVFSLLSGLLITIRYASLHSIGQCLK